MREERKEKNNTSSYLNFDTLKRQSSKRLSKVYDIQNAFDETTSSSETKTTIPAHLITKSLPLSSDSSNNHVEEKHCLNHSRGKRRSASLTKRFGSSLRIMHDAQTLEPYRQVGDPELDIILDLCNDDELPGAG
eukprot:10035770-Ditylum_brightwellii.AAC.1